MNKNGFTLLEILLCIVIMGLAIAIVVPNVSKILEKSRIESAKSIEYMLEHNLELYNEKNLNSIWCTEDSDENCLTIGDKEVTLDELLTMNKNIYYESKD